MKRNPFIISGYISPEYFCDRERETENVTDAIRNRRHLTMFSPRRIGKTGLIKHVFYSGKKRKDFIPVYADILATGSIKDFTESFGKSVLSALAVNQPAIKKILRGLAAIRPKAGIDPVSGEPYITFTVGNEQDAIYSLDVVFGYLRRQDDYFAIAIDEFQQVAGYPEKNVEAVLRTHIQQTTNASMIFSGSRRHILTGIFFSPDRPFYNSTQMMEIGKIANEEYKIFIGSNFEKNGIKIEASAIDLILEITSTHTFYVQYLCNRLFGEGNKVTSDAVRKMIMKIITENEAVYASYINLLTPLQFRLLKAIAINGPLKYPTSGDFLTSHNLGAASSVSLAVKSLMDKEFINHEGDMYTLNDLFFCSWLRFRSGI
jgi:AAA+ ATPase superfamily predicted ATPase